MYQEFKIVTLVLVPSIELLAVIVPIEDSFIAAFGIVTY